MIAEPISRRGSVATAGLWETRASEPVTGAALPDRHGLVLTEDEASVHEELVHYLVEDVAAPLLTTHDVKEFESWLVPAMEAFHPARLTLNQLIWTAASRPLNGLPAKESSVRETFSALLQNAASRLGSAPSLPEEWSPEDLQVALADMQQGCRLVLHPEVAPLLFQPPAHLVPLLDDISLSASYAEMYLLLAILVVRKSNSVASAEVRAEIPRRCRSWSTTYRDLANRFAKEAMGLAGGIEQAQRDAKAWEILDSMVGSISGDFQASEIDAVVYGPVPPAA